MEGAMTLGAHTSKLRYGDHTAVLDTLTINRHASPPSQAIVMAHTSPLVAHAILPQFLSVLLALIGTAIREHRARHCLMAAPIDTETTIAYAFIYRAAVDPNAAIRRSVPNPLSILASTAIAAVWVQAI